MKIDFKYNNDLKTQYFDLTVVTMGVTDDNGRKKLVTYHKFKDGLTVRGGQALCGVNSPQGRDFPWEVVRIAVKLACTEVIGILVKKHGDYVEDFDLSTLDFRLKVVKESQDGVLLRDDPFEISVDSVAFSMFESLEYSEEIIDYTKKNWDFCMEKLSLQTGPLIITEIKITQNFL